MSKVKKSQNLISRLGYFHGEKSSKALDYIIQNAKELWPAFFKAEQMYCPSYGGPYFLNKLIHEKPKKLLVSE